MMVICSAFYELFYHTEDHAVLRGPLCCYFSFHGIRLLYFQSHLSNREKCGNCFIKFFNLIVIVNDIDFYLISQNLNEHNERRVSLGFERTE